MGDTASVPTRVTATPESRAVRAFFALSPNETVREALAALGRDIARRSRGRTVSPENAHLTLAFIGDVAKTAVPILEAVGDRLPKTGFVLSFDSLGAWRASGVAWIAPSVLPPPLLTLHSTLADALVAAGFELETRPFRCRARAARPSSGAATGFISSAPSCGPKAPFTATSRPGNWPSADVRRPIRHGPSSIGRPGSALHSLHDPG